MLIIVKTHIYNYKSLNKCKKSCDKVKNKNKSK